MLAKRPMAKLAIHAALVVACVLALGFVAVVVLANYPDRNMTERAMLLAVRSDIEGLQGVLQLYRERHGRYPRELSELTLADSATGAEALLKTLPHSPWGGPYQYKIRSAPAGDGYDVWVVPDDAMRKRWHISELSSATDWGSIQ